MDPEPAAAVPAADASADPAPSASRERATRHVRGRRRSIALGSVVALVAALAVPLPAAAAAPVGTVSARAVPAYDHVVVVVEENHGPDQVADAPFLASLIAGGASFPNARAGTHLSQPNYLDLWAGRRFGVDDNRCTVLTGDNLGAQALAAGLTVAGYAEDLPSAGSTACTAGSYVKRHNPIATFAQTAGPATNLPLTELPSDFAELPRLAYVLPNVDHDMHDGSVEAGDAWLQDRLGEYAAWARTHDSLLLVTFDEDDGTQGNRILNVLYGDHITPGAYSEAVTHQRDLATVEAALGLPALTDAAPITSAFDGTGVAAPVCTAGLAGAFAGIGSATGGSAPTSPTTPVESLVAALRRGGGLGAGRYAVTNFRAGTDGAVLPAAGLSGAGVDRTVLEMRPRTSTKGRGVPTTAYRTNQLSLLEANGSPTLTGFTLQGTDQGHLYNGLRVERATGARVMGVKVAAIPGRTNYPPGETFGINDYRTVGSVYCGIEVDGAGVGAAGFGANSSRDLTIRDAVAHDNPHSAGFTFWQTSDITLIDVTSIANRGGLNFERDSGAIRIVRPVLGSIRNEHDISVNSDVSSATVTIVDPVLPPHGTLKILVSRRYHGGPNHQRRTDIRVLVGGVDRTHDLVEWVG